MLFGELNSNIMRMILLMMLYDRYVYYSLVEKRIGKCLREDINEVERDWKTLQKLEAKLKLATERSIDHSK
jgi:hypothetical protein